jgi:4-hydroxy-L-threonine phosphate dehydrogenase PdxA
MSKNFKPIIIVTGDPNSIFYEIFFKTFKKINCKNPIILITCKKKFFREAKIFKFIKKVNIIDLKKTNFIFKRSSINLIDIELKVSKNKKNNDILLNNYIEKSFDFALKLIKEKISNKLLNGPINKKKFLNKEYLGVTEYIASKINKREFGMLIYNKSLSVCPMTTHLPIKKVVPFVTKKNIIEKVVIINEFYKNFLKIKPRIAVTGLNPHCESILDFNEDDKITKPTIKLLKKKGFSIDGPFPADTIFLKDNRKNYDVILGMYHDQVLTPIKTLFEFNAINITMGLPFLRVSPDHGPNYKMVGKNISNHNSLLESVKFLDQI